MKQCKLNRVLALLLAFLWTITPVMSIGALAADGKEVRSTEVRCAIL